MLHLIVSTEIEFGDSGSFQKLSKYGGILLWIELIFEGVLSRGGKGNCLIDATD